MYTSLKGISTGENNKQEILVRSLMSIHLLLNDKYRIIDRLCVFYRINVIANDAKIDSKVGWKDVQNVNNIVN